MEEVKNQIGEQLPGALDLFVAAASEFTGKELTTPEFFKMMQDGELLAKDILPLMGKMMSAAAKKGGALEKMLLSNGVAMRRLTQTWQNFQNEFFKGGFGQSMTDTFNVLAQMLKDNTGLAGQLGKAFKAVMDNLLDGFTLAYDIARMFWWEMDDALFSKIPEGMKTWLGDMAAIIAAVAIATVVFRGLYGLLKMIFGMGSLSKSLGLGGVTKTTEAGKTSKTSKVIGAVGSFLAVDQIMEALIGDTEFGQWAKNTTLGGIFSTPEMRTDLRPSLRMPTSLPSTQNPQNTNVKDVNLDLNIKVDEGMLKDIIDVQIKEEQQKIFNKLYQE